jgi:hypothetical protein
VDAVEPRVRASLAEYPQMPATVIAERIRWSHSLTIATRRHPTIVRENASTMKHTYAIPAHVGT